MGGSTLKDLAALESLFRHRVTLFDAYAGLLHLATRAGRAQRFEEAAKRHHEQGAKLVRNWTQSIGRWDDRALEELGHFLLAEAKKPRDRAAVAVTSALQVLDRAVSQRAIEAHNEEVHLPADEPFSSARYRLLRPPEEPILNWIEESGCSEIPRRSSDSRIDLPETLGLRWRLFPVEPNPFLVTASFENLPVHVAAQLSTQIEQRRLVFGVVSPVNGLNYDVRAYSGEVHEEYGTPYRFQEMTGDRTVAEGEVEAILERCRELEVDVLMYPELTLDTDLLGHLKNQLAWHNDDGFPAMVIAGSFHEPADEAGRHVNRTRVFDHLGHEILRHDKLKEFRLTAHDIQGIPEDRREAFCRSFGVDAALGGRERIQQGRRLRVVDGPLGRMITAICLDYCGTSIDELAKASRSNLFWIPAMTPSLGAFHRRARDLGQSCRATTVVVNSEWLLEVTGVEQEKREQLRSLCYLPYRTRKIDPFEADSKLPSLRLFRIGEIFNDLSVGVDVH